MGNEGLWAMKAPEIKRMEDHIRELSDMNKRLMEKMLGVGK